MSRLPVFDLRTRVGLDGWQDRLHRLRQTASASGEAAATVQRIIEDVREHGDAAVVRYMRQWTDPDFTADRIRVMPEELAAAEASLSKPMRDALTRSIEHVRAYQRHILPQPPAPVMIDGAELGMRFTPVDSVGCAVPGGAAVLFSTLIMLAAPAQVAGVPASRISVINPPPTRKGDEPAGDISPLVLATCRLLGIDKVYRIGGAQAIASLAFGTAEVEPVDLIAGPGNVFVQLAKQMVSGVVGTDNGFYGPSEIVTVADASAKPRRVAADLLAQAEHNPGKCFLVTWSRDLIDDIEREMDRMIGSLPRRDAIESALKTESAALLVRDADQAAQVADTIAAEHVNLAVADPSQWLGRLKHGGEFFLGDQTPVAAGDYYAGPSHCLPTGTTARFASGISVYTFLKRSGTVGYPQGMSPRTIADIARLAEAEGLDAHALSVRVRGE
ncbi:MAG: histidinol dehydrogenase [Phycisphaeraceae bacterium]|nr:histidinol dehydrogenase [Phycisphaeraceae bacterium]